MTNLQKIQLQQSEVRSQLAEELDKSEEERTEGLLEDLTKRAQRLEVEYRAALALQEETAQPDRVDTPEGRELNELRSRVNFGEYVSAAMAGRGVIAGPELEYNQELGLREDFFPIDLLAPAPAVETRAARDGDAQTNQQTWIDRVFGMSAAAFIGVTFRSVNPGVAAVPITTAGGGGAQRGRTEAVTESTYTVAVTELKPTRAAVLGIYSIEDDLRLPGLADAIMRDMRMGMADAIDKKIFNGDAGANENGADITGLQTASITEVTLTQADKVKPDKWMAVLAGFIDGLYAPDVNSIRMAKSVGTAQLLYQTLANPTYDNETLAAYLMANGLQATTREGIDTASANGDFGGYFGLQRGIEGTAVAAVWNQGQLIRDPYSSATKGEVQLTLSYYWNFQLVRAANYKRLKYVT